MTSRSAGRRRSSAACTVKRASITSAGSSDDSTGSRTRRSISASARLRERRSFARTFLALLGAKEAQDPEPHRVVARRRRTFRPRSPAPTPDRCVASRRRARCRRSPGTEPRNERKRIRPVPHAAHSSQRAPRRLSPYSTHVRGPLRDFTLAHIDAASERYNRGGWRVPTVGSVRRDEGGSDAVPALHGTRPGAIVDDKAGVGTRAVHRG